MSPMPGIFESNSVTRLSTSPAIANVWPSARLISDSTRRVDNAGSTKPFRVTLFEKSRVLTSGFTFRWIVPSPLRIGKKLSRIPNSLNWIVTAFPAVPVLEP